MLNPSPYKNESQPTVIFLCVWTLPYTICANIQPLTKSCQIVQKVVKNGTKIEVTYRNFPLCLDNSVYNLCKYLAHSTAPGQCRLQTSKTSSSSFVDFVAFMSAKKEILRSINRKKQKYNFCFQAQVLLIQLLNFIHSEKATKISNLEFTLLLGDFVIFLGLLRIVT